MPFSEHFSQCWSIANPALRRSCWTLRQVRQDRPAAQSETNARVRHVSRVGNPARPPADSGLISVRDHDGWEPGQAKRHTESLPPGTGAGA